MSFLTAFGLSILAWSGFVIVREYWLEASRRMDWMIDEALRDSLQDEDVL